MSGPDKAIGVYTGHSKDFLVMVEPLKCSVKHIEVIFSENTLACDVVKLRNALNVFVMSAGT